MAGRPAQRDRLPAGLRDRVARLHSSAPVIRVGLAAPRRAVGLTGLVLGAALLRALLLPLGDLLSTLVFGACLLGVAWVETRAPTLPSPASEGGEWRGLVGMTGSLV